MLVKITSIQDPADYHPMPLISLLLLEFADNYKILFINSSNHMYINSKNKKKFKI
jgi:hypothetical protein